VRGVRGGGVLDGPGGGLQRHVRRLRGGDVLVRSGGQRGGDVRGVPWQRDISGRSISVRSQGRVLFQEILFQCQ
jgi:hypothetical protein